MPRRRAASPTSEGGVVGSVAMRGAVHLGRLLTAAGSVLLVGCLLIQDFDLSPEAETTAELCSDGRDNDFDGLGDCQDWSCQEIPTCCDIPEVIIEDDFEGGPADCAATECVDATCAELQCGPDDEVWHTWPCPYPKVCDGAFRIEKTLCFAAGALSRASVMLQPGLRAEADLVGRPEQMGYLEIALTLQEEAALPGSLDPCERDQHVTGFASLRQVWAEEGYELSARLHETEVGRSAAVTDTMSPHTVAVGIDQERRIVYYLDGDAFATAPNPLPPTAETARLALSGLTAEAAIEAVRVQAGLRCHDPSSWRPLGVDIEASVVLAGDSEIITAFDRDEVYHPSVRMGDSGIELYYTGCSWPSGTFDCDPDRIGVGRATSVGLGAYARHPENPWLVPEDIPLIILVADHTEMSVDVLPSAALRAFVAPAGDRIGIFALGESPTPVTEALPEGKIGQWDGYEICCATALEHPDGTTYLWYAGRERAEDYTWRIGLATSTDGIVFERFGDNPVLVPGPPGDFDSEAVLNPTVVFDATRALFRMWYQGRDFFAKTRVGYAVSTDGATWHRSPDNPVIAPEDLGLATIGGPEVLLANDGRLHAWVHGNTIDNPRRRIFALTNSGTLLEP